MNTSSFGLPPRTAFEAMAAAADEWRHGRTGYDGWDLSVAASRASFARLHGVAADDVAISANVSAFTGLVAHSLERGARVVCAEDDFTSVLFPLLAAEARGVQVELVPLERVAEAIDSSTALVAVSAVQSKDGRVADLDAIAAAAAHHGTRTFIDASQAAGWLPIDAARFDHVVAVGYKFLLGPRGCAFLAIRPEAAERLTPVFPGWYAGEVPLATVYGGPLRLAASARRFDLSPAWSCWVGQAPALALLEDVGIAAVWEHDVALANRFRAGLGMEASDSAIVSAPLDAAAKARLDAAAVMVGGLAGEVRLSFHLYTTESDVDHTLDAIAG